MGLRLMIADLQPTLMEVHLERDVLQDTRQKESQSQENVEIQLENTIKELEAANQLQEEMLREADCETERLKKMVHSHEEALLELRGILMDYEGSTGKKLCEHERITSLYTHNLSTAFAHVLQDLDSEVSYLKEKVVLVEEEIESLKKDSRTQNQLLFQPHQNREQTINQNSVCTHQVSHLEPAISQLHSELREAKRLYEDKVAAIKENNESLERISSLTVQLESTKEALCKVKDDLTAKQIDLETAEEKVSHLMAHLQEKKRALEVASKETKKLHSQLGSRMQELQHLKKEGGCLHSSECEALKLQLMEKERIIYIFQKQIDNMTQLAGQYSGTAGAMEVEKSQLMKERNDWKLKEEELKTAKDEKEARIQEMEATLSELEQEKVKLINTCGERLQALNNMRLEKDQLMNKLQASRSELAGLLEGFEDLKRDYQDKMKEMGNTANRLQMQLKSTQAELERTRTALKTMERSDGHAVKAAVGMQKQITANRGQIDALQSKMKFLEEAMTNAAKEKHYLREENSKLSQELSCITAENTKIAEELEILRSRDKRLKEKIPQMETALEKASMQLAECQCIIQCQEQEAMCFRLQHALDVKPGILKEEPLQDLKRILQELTSSGSDIPSVDPGKDDSNGGRKSPLGTMRNTVEAAAGDSAAESSMEKDAFGWNPSCLRTADLHSQGSPSVPSASCPKKVSREERYRERSPVHLLLTALPSDLAAGPSASPEQGLSVRKVGWLEGAPTVPHIRSQPTETSENTPMRLQNKMGSLQCPLESLQIKKQATSSLVRPQEMTVEKAKGKEKLSKCRRRMN